MTEKNPLSRTGGSLLAEALQRADLSTVFCLHGGHLDAFFVACEEYGVTLLDTRHEASAGHAAAGYAKATGEPAVAMVTSGPGFLNVVTAVGDAYLDRMPMVVIAGAPPLRESERNLLQAGFDQVGLIRPVTKWAYQVTHPWRIPEIIQLARAKAVEGAPGPVLVEIPIDVMFDEVDPAAVRFPAFTSPAAAASAPAEVVEQVLDMILDAERPLVFVGGGGTLSGAQEELREAASRLGLPVVTANKSEGIIAHDDPAHAGDLATAGVLAVQGMAADLVVLLGQRQGMFTGGNKEAFPDARVVQVDLDAAEIGRVFDVEVPIVADVRQFLIQILAAADGRRVDDRPGEARTTWVRTVHAMKDYHAQLFADPATESGRLHPYHASKALMEALPEDVGYVLDGGENASWASYHLKARNAGDVLRIGYLGCLGVGPGYAIGSYTARPRTTVLLTGDGALGFNLPEWETMVRHGLPILTVVYNNAVWGMSIHGQEAVYGEKGAVVSTLADTNYDEVCAAFGGYGERVTSLEDIPGAVDRALTSGLPACLNIEIDPFVVHPVTLRMLGDIDSPDEIIVPYYSNFPRT